MPGGKIADDELRHRLEEYKYNVPPITDTTRNLLVNKLKKFDDEAKKKRGSFNVGIDYSSAEEDFTPPVSSTRKSARSHLSYRTKVSARNGSVSKEYCDFSVKPNKGMPTRNGGSLMNQSEEDDDEDDSEDAEEDSEDKFDEYDEEEITTRNDLGIQTSFDSPDCETRFRGKTFTPTTSPANNSNQPYPIKSQHLRKNLDQFGSLNEALSTLPTNKPGSCLNSAAGRSQPTTTVQHASPLTQSMRQPSNRKGNRSHSRLIPSMIVSVAIIFFLFLSYQYLNLRSDQNQQILPLCTASVSSSNCIPKSELEGTTELLKRLLEIVKKSPSCRNTVQNKFSVDELRVQLNLETELANKYFEYSLMLLKRNPSWGIDLLYNDEGSVTHLVSARGVMGVVCWTQYAFHTLLTKLVNVANYVVFVSFIFGVAFLLVKAWMRWREQRVKEKEEVFLLIDRVLAMLYEQHMCKEKYSASYLAIDHVRDQLIQPHQRENKAKVWREVLKYMKTKESRVREEVQYIHGEEFRVWQWLPDIPAATPSPPRPSLASTTQSAQLSSNPPNTSNESKNYARKVNTTRKPDSWPFAPTSTSAGSPGWQGSAIQVNQHLSAPSEPPTSCLKVRYMFDLAHLSEELISNLKKDIIGRCSEARLLHIAVDTDSKEGVVYIKTMSTDDAGLVYKKMHDQWYNGKLVTVKYLRKDRYHQRFPDSINLENPLKQ